jgi:hypothetical protein
MSDFLDYPDNLILHLERDRRSYKCFTTDQKDKFKIINGLSEKDSVIDTKYYTLRELKQLMVDSVINGYTLKSNLIFKQGIHGIVNELAAERREQMKQQELLSQEELSAEVVSDSDDEKVKVTYEQNGEEKMYEVVPEI